MLERARFKVLREEVILTRLVMGLEASESKGAGGGRFCCFRPVIHERVERAKLIVLTIRGGVIFLVTLGAAATLMGVASLF